MCKIYWKLSVSSLLPVEENATPPYYLERNPCGGGSQIVQITKSDNMVDNPSAEIIPKQVMKNTYWN